MAAPSETEIHVPGFLRKWGKPAGFTAAFVYAGQVAPFFAGPLMECGHCVKTFVKLFPITPGILAGQWLMQFNRWIELPNDLLRFFLPGTLTTLVLLGTATILTAATRGLGRIAWLAALCVMSALNALAVSEVLRA